jgi:hypothetical protein
MASFPRNSTDCVQNKQQDNKLEPTYRGQNKPEEKMVQRMRQQPNDACLGLLLSQFQISARVSKVRRSK